MSTAAGEPLGGPAEEARRLVEALGDWASTRLETADEHIATGSAECQLCPICAVISALRGDRAEAVARLGQAWAAFLGVLTEHHHPPGPGDPPAPAEPSSSGSDPETGGQVRPVQNIDVG